MGWIFLIIAILVLVTLAIQYSYITLALGAIWLVIHLIVKEHKEEKSRQAAEAERKACRIPNNRNVRRLRQQLCGESTTVSVFGRKRNEV